MINFQLDNISDKHKLSHASISYNTFLIYSENLNIFFTQT